MPEPVCCYCDFGYRSQDKYDLRVFRLCALWFANSSNPTVNKLIKVRVHELIHFTNYSLCPYYLGGVYFA